jgi:hypothetical protein
VLCRVPVPRNAGEHGNSPCSSTRRSRPSPIIDSSASSTASNPSTVDRHWMTEPTWRPQFNDRTPRPAADVLRPIWLLDHDWLNKLPRWGEPARWLYPASRLLRLEGREPVRSLLPDDEGYAAACDRLECLASYAAVDAAREPSRHAPWMGEFILDSRSDGNGLAAQIAVEIDDHWPMLAAFDGDVERARKAAEDTVEFIRQHGRTW